MIDETVVYILSKINVEYIIKHVKREERPELPVGSTTESPTQSPTQSADPVVRLLRQLEYGEKSSRERAAVGAATGVQAAR